MEFPANVLAIAQKIAKRHGEDIPRAVDEAERLIRKLPEFPQLVDTLVRSCIQDLIYDTRHRYNVATKKAAGGYGGKAIVTVGLSPAVKAISQSVYSLYVAGKTLGSVLGEELNTIAETERNIGDGHYVNAELVASLVGVVPAKKTVRESVSERRLMMLLKAAQRKVNKAAA